MPNYIIRFSIQELYIFFNEAFFFIISQQLYHLDILTSCPPKNIKMNFYLEIKNMLITKGMYSRHDMYELHF